MELYGIKAFDVNDLVKGIKEAKAYWKKELERALVAVPDYNVATGELLASIGQEADT